MNLRQKNKKLKQELALYKTKAVPIKIEARQRPIVELRYISHLSEMEFIKGIPDGYIALLKKRAIENMLVNHLDLASFETYKNPKTCDYVFECRLSVVDRGKEV